MNWFTNTVSSSIGRKYIMSITGLFLIVFLIAHLLGNFLLVKNDGGQAFNEYAHFMTSNPFIQIIRVLNFVFILMHIIYSIILTYLNKKARPISYRFKMNVSNSTWMSRNMGVLGLIILIFLLIHLRTFLYTMNFGDIPYVEYNGNYIKNLYVIVVKAFSKLWYTALYVF